MSTVTLRHLEKRFIQTTAEGQTTVTAIDDLSLNVPNGQVLALLGESGCGKSTLLRLVAGLIPPDSGEILFDHEPLESIPFIERGIGMVFQDGALMPHWESRRTVGFHLWLRKRQREVPARLARIVQITGFDLDTLMERRPRQLSGGERQRVAVARALMRDPRVFLFDEPFSNIDAKLRVHARVELRRLLNEFPVTSIYVTHDQYEAASLGDKIGVMRAGKIEQIDTYIHLYHDPVNLFVAQFIGTPSINIFRGKIISHRWQGVNFGGFPVRGDLPDGKEILVGIRQENIRLADDGIPAQVSEVTPYFAERFQSVEVEAKGESWTVRLPPEVSIQRGEMLRCALDPNELLFFDPVTGRRIG